MNNLDQALADIANIRSQMAAGTVFQGFGPEVMALTGLLALLTMIAQLIWPSYLAGSLETMLWTWVCIAVVSATLVAIEARARAKRHHGGLADQMVQAALEQFLPAGFAGATLFAVLLVFGADYLWLLPGLWQILVALGIFAAIRMLPNQILIVAAWYFLAGVTMLIVSLEGQSISPWMMGVPFAVGQWLMAALLHFAQKEDA